MNGVVNSAHFKSDSIANLKYIFNTNKPIRHVIIDDFLKLDFTRSLYENFPLLGDMKTHYRGINEKKSESSDFKNLHPDFEGLHNSLCSEDFIKWVSAWSGIESLNTINDRLGYGLHQGGNNSFLDIHIDYNIHPIKKLFRKLNLIIFFNQVWEKDWGGQLELWDENVQNCIQSITPVFNRCVIFECSEISYHGYKKMAVPENITRKSYYQYYFTPVLQPVNYHDTMFKPRPDESIIKKLSTSVKEWAKNTAKKILLHSGLEKYLK
jgi:hypothetical protein